METVPIVIAVIFIFFAYSGIKIVPQSQEYIVEEFGKYIRTLKAGLHFIVLILNTVTHRVNILERQLEPQQIGVITKDNVEIVLTTTVFFRVIDPAKSVYRIRDVDQAVRTTVTSIVRATGG